MAETVVISAKIYFSGTYCCILTLGLIRQTFKLMCRMCICLLTRYYISQEMTSGSPSKGHIKNSHIVLSSNVVLSSLSNSWSNCILFNSDFLVPVALQAPAMPH